MSKFPWSLLGIAATGDAKAIRSAYAARIKAMDLDADVEGYADLRRARDAALRLAKRIAAEAEAEEPPAPVEPEPAARWTHAAPVLDGAWEVDPALTTQPAMDTTAPFAPVSLEARKVEPESPAAIQAADPFTPPLLEVGPAPAGVDEATIAAGSLQPPAMQLAALLDPARPGGLVAMEPAEEARASALLRTVIDTAHLADIAGQGQIEDWLADLLAQGWPRSAPLIEDTAAAFGWDREWGKIDARPAVDYLGTRLRGYRFERKVSDKGHRYHKAWVELGRPGPAGPWRWLRAAAGDVTALLAGIRRHFPEVEQHLDPERVASWEKTSRWPAVGFVTLFLALIGILVGTSNLDPAPRPTLDPAAAAQLRAIDAATSAATVEAFGQGYTPGWLRQRQSELAVAVEQIGRSAVQSGAGPQTAVRKTVDLVRQRTYLDGRTLFGTYFDRAMQLRLDLLKAAQAKNAVSCVLYLNSGQMPPDVVVPSDVRAAERDFAALLAGNGLLVAPKPSGPTNARVPGLLTSQVMGATGLKPDAVVEAMQGKGPDAHRCAVAIALLEATLAWQGKERKAILLTL
jgi:hypothetical protein